MDDINYEGTYYRALKDSFMWRAGVVLELDEKTGGDGGYSPLNKLNVWDNTLVNGTEYISHRIIENAPEWFEQVYPVQKEKRGTFVTKEEAIEKYKWDFKK